MSRARRKRAARKRFTPTNPFSSASFSEMFTKEGELKGIRFVGTTKTGHGVEIIFKLLRGKFVMVRERSVPLTYVDKFRPGGKTSIRRWTSSANPKRRIHRESHLTHDSGHNFGVVQKTTKYVNPLGSPESNRKLVKEREEYTQDELLNYLERVCV